MDQKLLDQMKALLQAAYDAGRQAGAEEVRAAILAAVNPSGPPLSEIPTLKEALARRRAAGGSSELRAPRGALPSAVKQALSEKPGQTELELVEAVQAINPQISPRSIGGQLRRFRDEVYRQEGRKWFLLEGETAEKASAIPADPF